MKKRNFKLLSEYFWFWTLGLFVLCPVTFGHGPEGHGSSAAGGGGEPAANFAEASSAGRAGSAGCAAKAGEYQKQAEQGGNGQQAQSAKLMRDLYLAQALMQMRSANANADAARKAKKESDDSTSGTSLPMTNPSSGGCPPGQEDHGKGCHSH